MFYIKVQPLDYDDYPQGTPVRIGPFGSTEEAEVFLDESNQFVKRNVFSCYFDWQMPRMIGKHSVNVCSLSDELRSPSEFLS